MNQPIELYPMRHEQFLKQGIIDLLNWSAEKLHLKNSEQLIHLHALEVGSYAGESANIMAPYFCTFSCCDPWLDNYDPNDVAATFAPMNAVEEAFNKVQYAHRNIVKHKKTSDDLWTYLRTFSTKRMFRFVYIDGMHTYEQVKKDIIGCQEFMKEGFCIIAGHDYQQENWPQVVQAIHETVGTPDATFCDTSWAKVVLI